MKTLRILAVLAALSVFVFAVSLFVSADSVQELVPEYNFSGCDFEYTSVDNEKIDNASEKNELDIFIFFTANDSNSFLQLDDVSNSEIVDEPTTKVIAVEMSGKSDDEIKYFRDTYGFSGITFCSGKTSASILDYYVKKTDDPDAKSKLVTVISDQAGSIRYVYKGYKAPDVIQQGVEGLLIVPDIPQDITAASVDANTVKVSWKPITSAFGYAVYKSDSFFGDFTQAAVVSGSEYIDKNLRTGASCYYKIKSIINTDGGKVESAFSACANTNPIPEQPALELNNSFSSVKIKFDPVKGADGYVLFRSAIRDGNYIRIEEGEGLSFTDSNVDGECQYFYKVLAYHNSDSVRIYGKSTDSYSIMTK